LAKDVVAVQAAVDACAEPPVLVAHSYGGAVAGHVTGARAMLLVTAFVLEVGESCAAVAGPAPCRPAIVVDPDGTTSLDPALAPEYFFADGDPAEVARAVRLLVPQARGHWGAPAAASTWREVPTRYVVCEQDRAVDVGVQRRLAARCTSAISIPTSHSPFLSAVEVLVEQVDALA
jgi:pimeloyl-ACP methyl ester carboxylesterase